MADKVDDAIVAAAAAPPPLDMVEIPIHISSTGRPAFMACPADLTDHELIDLATFVLLQLRPFIARSVRPSGLVIPNRIRNQ